MSALPPQDRKISMRAVVDTSTPQGRRLHRFAPFIDRLLGIHHLDDFYQRHALADLPAHTFASNAIDALGVTVDDQPLMASRLPTDGPVIIVANHPHGGIEGLVMVKLLARLRPDFKVMANIALRLFRELSRHFIFVNPLDASDPANRRGFRDSLALLRSGGVLVVFPAGRTSFFQPDLDEIADAQWSRSVARLARKSGAKILPVRFTGQNSPLFYRLGSIWYRFRLLMLARELIKTRDRTLGIRIGKAFDVSRFKGLSDAALTDVIRLSSATLRAPRDSAGQPAMASLRQAHPRADVCKEIAGLPASQHVLSTGEFVVGFGRHEQFPALLDDVTRERERTFRELDEGSGRARDTDEFDAVYDHLFCWHQPTRSLVGAYRIGRRDQIDAGSGSYLERMFDFDAEFFMSRPPALELGRSFITPEFQRSRQALDLLWRGIGGFLRAHPHYGTLYGTVSLSRQYDPVSVAMICDTLITPDATVRAVAPLPDTLGAEWRRFRANHEVDLKLLSSLVSARESDDKGIPVLLRHYAGLGAQFHAVGVDRHFADTPGLLLSVDLAALPRNKRKRYLES
ncbi:MAG: lysophospholipid acyltransferase family protein [Pseudomonadota bacterium]